MSAFRFENPLAFLTLLFVLPVIARVLARRRREAVTFSSLALLDEIPASFTERIRPIVPWLRVVGLVCVVVALARPQQGLSGFRVRKEGIAIQICLDRSVSMSAEDFTLNGEPVSRLVAVKEVIRQFAGGDKESALKGRPDDQLGLIAFGGFAEVRCPQTLDHDMFLEILRDVRLPEPARNADGSVIQEAYDLYSLEGGTAIGDALATAVEQLQLTKGESKVIVLLSDGENRSGILSPEQATEIAKQYGVRVYCVGVGTTGRHFVRIVDIFGNVQYQPMTLKLDEKTLTTIAQETGGKYFHAENTAALLDVYREIDELEKTSTEGAKYLEYRELCQPWLFAGLLLITLQVVAHATFLRGAL